MTLSYRDGPRALTRDQAREFANNHPEKRP